MGRTDAHGAYEPLLCDIPQNLSNSFNAPKLRSDYSAAFTRSARIGFSKLRTLRCASQSTSNMNTCDAPRQTETQAHAVSVRRIGSPKAEFLRYASNIIFEREHMAPPVTVDTCAVLRLKQPSFYDLRQKYGYRSGDTCDESREMQVPEEKKKDC